MTFPLDGMEAGWFGAGMNSSEKKIAKALLERIQKLVSNGSTSRDVIAEYHEFLSCVELRKSVEKTK